MTLDQLKEMPDEINVNGIIMKLKLIDLQTGGTWNVDDLGGWQFNECGNLKWLDVIYIE